MTLESVYILSVGSIYIIRKSCPLLKKNKSLVWRKWMFIMIVDENVEQNAPVVTLESSCLDGTRW